MRGVVVEARSVSKKYQLRSMLVEALRHVDLHAPPSRITAVYGPSGSGKSVLLNIIAGFEKPDRGVVRVGDLEVSSMRWGELVNYRRRMLGYAMQRNIVIPRLSVEENIALPLILRGISVDKAYREAERLASALGIDYALRRPAYTLSGGEQRRLIVARALITQPPLLLLDEPTSNLDENSARLVWRIIKAEAGRGATVIIATHDPLLRSGADALYLMEKGVSKCVKGCMEA